MQVHYETCLLDSSPLKLGQNFNKSLDSYCLLPQVSNSLGPLEHIACCPQNGPSERSHLIAVHLSANNQILVIDTKSHEKRDKFQLKAYDKKFSRQSFQVSGLAFSPDGQRLAVGQTDCIVYIYKLALPSARGPSGGGDVNGNGDARDKDQIAKTTITGKFVSSSPVTCLIWSELGIIFGGQDGKVRLILSFNRPPVPNQSQRDNQADPAPTHGQSGPKVVTLFTSSGPDAIPISLSYRPPILLVGLSSSVLHVLLIQAPSGDQETALRATTISTSDRNPGDITSQLRSIALASRRNSSTGSSTTPAVAQSLALDHSSPPVHLCIIQTDLMFICCVGSDGKLAFYSLGIQKGESDKEAAASDESPIMTSKLEQTIDVKEDILALDYSHVNEILALATKDRLLFVRHEGSPRETTSASKSSSSSWRLQASIIELRHVLVLSQVRWLPDGTQLAVGASNNSLHLFKCDWGKQTVSDKLDICHIARNRVRIAHRDRNSSATFKTSHDIKRVNLLDSGLSVLIWTAQSLLLARLDGAQSEIKWPRDALTGSRSTSKFMFVESAPGSFNFVAIFNEKTGELHLVRLGHGSVIYSAKLSLEASSPTMKREWLSIRQFLPPAARLKSAQISPERRDSSNGPTEGSEVKQDYQASSRPREQIERFAFVNPRNELQIIDLSEGRNKEIFRHKHDCPLEWLGFSHTGRFLAVLDRNRQLSIIKITQETDEQHEDEAEAPQGGRDPTFEITKLLPDCLKPLWLPESDSLVAQTGSTIHLHLDLDQRPPDVEKYDTRAYNFCHRAPLLDLSLSRKPEMLQPMISQARITKKEEGGQPIIELSNGQIVRLDHLTTKFHARLASDSLESAFELLQEFPAANGDAPEVRKRSQLYSKLGWLAIRHGNCELAIKIFTKLEYWPLVRYLEAAIDDGEEGQTSNQRAIKLAKLRGDWDKFEKLLTSDQETVIATYRRLNKWSRLVEYLARRQQFRQRDLAERDQLEWLLSKDRLADAAELKVRNSNDLVGALEMLLERDQLNLAADLILRERKLPLVQVAESSSGARVDLTTGDERELRELVQTRIRDKLASGAPGERTKAARISEQVLADSKMAIELYLGAGEYESALEVTKSHEEFASRVSEIHLQYANELRKKFLDNRQVSGKRARKAIGHYLASGHPERALEMANLLRMPQRAHDILQEHKTQLSTSETSINGVTNQQESDKELKEQCKELARQSLLAEQPAWAIDALEVAEDYEGLVDLLVKEDQLERAFQVSLEHLDGGDRSRTCEKFSKLAKDQAEQGQVDKAERIFLLADQIQQAVEMHERLGNHDRMLDLIERHQPEQLEASLLNLARSLEQAGQLGEAEKYLLRVSPGEWTNVVRMYRLARRWPDAFRVARENCLSDQDPLLVQLAYWWAKSLASPSSAETSGSVGCDQARELLDDLKLFKQVVEFCCEIKNFQFALDLCGASSASSLETNARIKRELVLRYATFLEQQNKFAEAEKLLVENQLIELAAKMYIDNDDHQAAIRVIERQLESTGEPAKGENQDAQNQARGRKQLVELLNSTLVECARRIVIDLSAASRRTPPVLMRSQSRSGGNLPTAGGDRQSCWAEKLQMAQQMFLRAQRPEMAIEMYQSMGMWQEAIQVAQRFAPRLLEQVERALDAQVLEDIEPILRETKPGGGGSPGATTEGANSVEETKARPKRSRRHLRNR